MTSDGAVTSDDAATLDDARPVPTVRAARFPADATHVSRLVGDYLLQTEREKAERGLAPLPVAGRLPERYRAEVENPAAAFSAATVLLAELQGAPVGVVVLTPSGDGASDELKRLWVDPEHRGAGAGRALLEAATARAATARLSVWAWRSDAISAYRRLGFVEVPSSETREGLVCMERTSAP